MLGCLNEVTQNNLLDYVYICETLEIHDEIEPFLKRLVTGDTKRII